MKIAYFDAFSGISGDMTVGALLDAGADFSVLEAALVSLNLGASVRVEKTKRKGISASKFHVEGGEQKAHRHLSHIIKILDAAALNDSVKQKALAVFQVLGEAEAKSHAVPIEKVHFHEVGAVDSICDIVGACVCLDSLGIDAIRSSAINTGSGTVKTEHGVLPVPAPATAELLRGKPVYARGPEMELTTPTGAALLAGLGATFGPLPAMTIQATGHGAGDRDFPEHANVLRVILGDVQQARESTTIRVLETNVDDSTPEVLGYAMERLLEAGALDVTLTPIYMKKNRPATLLRVLANLEDEDKLAQLVLAETSALGLRLYTAERRVQPRQFERVETSFGSVRIKAEPGGGFAPEYEDCRELARAAGVPLKAVLAEASASYLLAKGRAGRSIDPSATYEGTR
jgi:pyridinium-3,5-bisthiocarboxylic acid mononucleotide nickel chelatase